jgi:hypothetical protein
MSLATVTRGLYPVQQLPTIRLASTVLNSKPLFSQQQSRLIMELPSNAPGIQIHPSPTLRPTFFIPQTLLSINHLDQYSNVREVQQYSTIFSHLFPLVQGLPGFTQYFTLHYPILHMQISNGYLQLNIRHQFRAISRYLLFSIHHQF